MEATARYMDLRREEHTDTERGRGKQNAGTECRQTMTERADDYVRKEDVRDSV